MIIFIWATNSECSLCIQPRNGSQDEDLDECLTIQGFHFGLAQSAANGHKFTRHKSIKTEKDIGEAISHNGTSVGKMVHDTQRLQQQQIAPTYMIGDGNSNGYYTAALSCNGHINPSSSGVMMASPTSIGNQCSPSVINSQVSDNCYESTLPGVMNAYLPTYSSASGDVHAANPTSPMQTSYTPVQSVFPLEGANTMHSVPSHPPPNYTEATSMTGDIHYGHFPPNYDSIMSTASEYPSHLPANLPKTHIS